MPALPYFSENCLLGFKACCLSPKMMSIRATVWHPASFSILFDFFPLRPPPELFYGPQFPSITKCFSSFIVFSTSCLKSSCAPFPPPPPAPFSSADNCFPFVFFPSLWSPFTLQGSLIRSNTVLMEAYPRPPRLGFFPFLLDLYQYSPPHPFFYQAFKVLHPYR